ncbi:MAG: carbon-nitrogen hydrolase family protein [Thiothrix sp.]|nr:MAG: carbon-nitrogen hydrolase family protein [Thiothrix sp.]
MSTRIALAQCAPMPNQQQALAYLEQLLKQAKAQQVQLVVLPEMFLTGYNIGVDAVQAQALDLAAKGLAQVQALVARYQVALVVGFPECDQQSIFNSVAFLGEQGQILSIYRKTHLYGSVDQSQFRAGCSLGTVFTWQGWQCALAICYDIEFPEVARSYALQGAELLLVPTANMQPFELVCCHTIPSRAAENTIYLAYANYVGSEAEFNYCGLSCMCDPQGQVLARASRDQPELLIAELEPALLKAAREALPYLTDRRPHLYQY